ncbi:GlxA family transcriptional regulator [Burkholderia lata]|uniref:GlxA family transcriptional regulator n=1 Tax=Burkholderia lata (strain ATCC 17760 / DSM 23089 / LMG 22485 / NCIMB 9086 / R18194 / 383) TaxID=482957 RepID=UPI00399B4155
MSEKAFFMRIQPFFDFTILLLDGAYPSSVALTLDILSAAASLSEQVGIAAPRWRVYSVAGPRVQLGHGFSIEAKPLPKNPHDDGSIWIVPGLGLESPIAVPGRMEQDDALEAIKALRIHARRGGTVAASCSSVFLLQEAGLLAGRRATTSWWLAPLLQRLGKDCTVDADRMVIEDSGVVTAGAAFAQVDLLLYLLRVKFGPALADSLSRVLLVDARRAQAPFIAPSLLATGSELIDKIIAYVESSMPVLPSLTELAAQFCMSERTLTRHVRIATGRSTQDLLQSVRFGRARMLLATTRMTVEQIAEQVGYGDATALRRMMRKLGGATPRQFRPTAYEA